MTAGDGGRCFHGAVIFVRLSGQAVGGATRVNGFVTRGVMKIPNYFWVFELSLKFNVTCLGLMCCVIFVG